MNKVQRISSLRAAVMAAKKDKKSIAFVPTMGNLHDGHLELVNIAKRHGDFVVVSIYVNPTQFGENEDFENYPSTPEQDARLLAESGADLLFLPTSETMYPGDLDKQTVVQVPNLGDDYCGLNRPDHFQGVTTVVSRLFNMVLPDVAVFGKKDYQQLAIIRKMVSDLAFPVKVVGVETARNEDGLALSSRNGYLTEKELKKAAKINRLLGSVKQEIEAGATNFRTLEKQALKKLKSYGFEPHYFNICRQSDLSAASKTDKELVILTAAVVGKARLLDNVEVDLAQTG